MSTHFSLHLSRRALLARGLAGSAAILAAAPAGSALAAHTDPFSDYPAYNPALNGERATLHLWLTPDLASQPAYRTAIDLFQRRYPLLRVQVTPISRDDISQRLKLAVAAGGGAAVPDLVSDHAYVYGAQGLADESDMLWYAWGAENTFLPSALGDVTWRLNKFGIPLVGNAVVTILNTAMFHKAGVPLPSAHTTFAQFTSAVSAVKRANGARYGMVLSADPATVTALVHANGGALLSLQPISGRNIAHLTDPRVIDAIRFYTELSWKQHLAPLPPESSSNRTYLAQLFALRQAPAFFGTLSDLSLIAAVDSSIPVAIAPLPGGTTGKTSGSVNDGLSLFVPDAPAPPTRHPHAAFELGKWLVARPPALAVARSLHLAPTVAAYYDDSYFHHDALTSAYFQVARVATPLLLDAYAEPFDLYRGALRACFGGSDAGRQMRSIAGAVQSAMDKADAGIDVDG